MHQLQMTLTGPVKNHNLESRGWHPRCSQVCMIELATGERIQAEVTYRGTLFEIIGSENDRIGNGHVLYIDARINDGVGMWLDVALDQAPGIVSQDWLAGCIAHEVLAHDDARRIQPEPVADPEFWAEFQAEYCRGLR
jgi:hypothetical protein